MLGRRDWARSRAKSRACNKPRARLKPPSSRLRRIWRLRSETVRRSASYGEPARKLRQSGDANMGNGAWPPSASAEKHRDATYDIALRDEKRMTIVQSPSLFGLSRARRQSRLLVFPRRPGH